MRATSPRRLEPQAVPAIRRQSGGLEDLAGSEGSGRRSQYWGGDLARTACLQRRQQRRKSRLNFIEPAPLNRGYRIPRWPPPRLRLLSGREEPAARPRPRETTIADESARPPRDQKAEKPTPQRTGKPSRAGGATSPRQQWTSSRGSNRKGMGGGATAPTVRPLEPRHQTSAR